jgi:hypothetical protein|tara:strand:+ start:143 stop:301 length:159 start_codon:yes stop_codon:yes gene_type:complete
MAQGDVDVQIVAATTTAVDTAVTAMRTTANDKWLMCSIANGLQVMIVNIEEA